MDARRSTILFVHLTRSPAIDTPQPFSAAYVTASAVVCCIGMISNANLD